VRIIVWDMVYERLDKAFSMAIYVDCQAIAKDWGHDSWAISLNVALHQPWSDASHAAAESAMEKSTSSSPQALHQNLVLSSASFYDQRHPPAHDHFALLTADAADLASVGSQLSTQPQHQ